MMVYYVSIKALVVDGDKILLSREPNGKWELPGGGMNLGETPTETLIREVREETGITAQVLNPRPIYVWTFPRVDTEYQGCNIGFHTSFESLEFVASDECTALEFFDAESVKSVEIFPNVAKLFELFNPTDFY